MVETECCELFVLIEDNACVFEVVVGVETSVDVSCQVFAKFEHHLVLNCLDGDFAVVEVHDDDVAELLGLRKAILINGGLGGGDV